MCCVPPQATGLPGCLPVISIPPFFPPGIPGDVQPGPGGQNVSLGARRACASSSSSPRAIPAPPSGQMWRVQGRPSSAGSEPPDIVDPPGLPWERVCKSLSTQFVPVPCAPATHSLEVISGTTCQNTLQPVAGGQGWSWPLGALCRHSQVAVSGIFWMSECHRPDAQPVATLRVSWITLV